MMKRSVSPNISFVVAAGIGLVYGWFQHWFWNFYVIDNPITDWLLNTFARQGQSELFNFLTGVHDFVVHLLLALGLAIVLIRRFGPRSWAHVLVVVAAWHVTIFWGAIWANMGAVISYWRFWINLATTLSVIPIAYLLAEKIRRIPADA